MHKPDMPKEAQAQGGTENPPATPFLRLYRLRQLVWRSTVASLVATALDGALYAWGVHAAAWDPGAAAAAGAIVGGLINYAISRVWVFGGRRRKLAEMGRFALVSLSGATLSSTCVHLWARHDPSAHPMLVWAVVKWAMSWGFYLPLQRYYVFGPSLLALRKP